MQDMSSSARARRRGNGSVHNSTMGGTYFLIFIGVAVYYIQHAASFWQGVLGILKAMVWPACLAHKLFEFLKM